MARALARSFEKTTNGVCRPTENEVFAQIFSGCGAQNLVGYKSND